MDKKLMTLGLLATLITQLFIYSPAAIYNSISDLSIPYEGLTLKWLSHFRFVDRGSYESEDILLFKYTKRILPEVFEVKQLGADQETYEINVITRQIMSGSSKGNFTTHWIATNLSIGDIVKIWNSEAIVASVEEEVTLSSIRGKPTVKCFRFDEVWTIESIDTTLEGESTRFYDERTGIKVKETSRGEGYVVIDGVTYECQTEELIILTEMGVDNDKDSLTDFEELFVTLTDPTKKDSDGDGIGDLDEDSDKDGVSDGVELSQGTNLLATDSDGDLWSDSIDFMPTNPITPNLLIVALIVVPIAIVVWRKKLRHLIREKVNEVSQTVKELF